MQTDAFLKIWHEAIAQRDLELMEPWIADDVALVSPALFKPKVGRKVVREILTDVLASFEFYRVTRTWIDGREILLEFDASVDGKQLQGIDRITLDEHGKMVQLKVFIRPFKGLQALIASVVRLQIGRLRGMQGVLARATYSFRSKLTKLTGSP